MGKQKRTVHGGSLRAEVRSKRERLTVGDFFDRYAEMLDLKRLTGEGGLKHIIREPTVNRPGLALAGFRSYFANKRIQVFGSAEFAYMKQLSKEVLVKRIRDIFERDIPAIIVCRGYRPPPHFLEEAEKAGISVFQTKMVTMNLISATTIALDYEFAPAKSEFGSMVDVMGAGVMIRGASGIGKSECVLGLIERGHSLVADDITKLRAFEGRELIGTSSDLTRHHMEVRGIGIIDVGAIFGVGAIRLEKRLDLIVSLKDWHELEEVDRIGLDQEYYTILDIPVPHITIPVRTGRDLARLVEVAALDQKLKSFGRHSAREFNERLLEVMQKRKPHNAIARKEDS